VPHFGHTYAARALSLSAYLNRAKKLSSPLLSNVVHPSQLGCFEIDWSQSLGRSTQAYKSNDCFPHEVAQLFSRTIPACLPTRIPLVRNARVLCILVHAKSRLFPRLVNSSQPYSTQLQYRSRTDPLIHHGRHFGRTVHALCTVSALLNNGILRMGELAEQPDETFTQE